ncbi:hypothetical protein QCA50_000120 [Cerrena zonata]|uniref:Vacuolar ATPase assembly integral membrane protein VMA21 n=1 Tax=Cerrena zonata TaxID=2478898 RepID=A0AAW0GZM4_9APHY
MCFKRPMSSATHLAFTVIGARGRSTCGLGRVFDALIVVCNWNLGVSYHLSTPTSPIGTELLGIMSAQAAVSKQTEQAAYNGGVLAKLLIFSFSLAVVPLTSYFLSEKYIWNGNSTFAAITAIVAANIVLVLYIIISVLEDKSATSQPPSSTTENKKTQ